MMTKGLDFIRSEKAASSAEFALVVFPFISIIMGIIGVGFMFWANTTLHYAAEDAARCASVKTTICADATSTQNYALSRYKGPAIAPAFSYAASGCGHTCTATATYPLNAGLFNFNVPLSASACFP
jgi:Flp pilus assembly protein TadG